MKNNFKFLIVLAILLAGCICVGSTFAAEITVDDVNSIDDVSSVDNTKNMEIAHDDSSQKEDINQLRAGEGNFTELRNLIQNATGDSVYLNKDYCYVEGDGLESIQIRSSLTINGNGHKINAFGFDTPIFFICNLKDNILVDFSNITFVNSSDSAIYFTNNGVVEYCNFINCHSTFDGGAIKFYGDYGIIYTSTFNNCSAKNGGAVYWQKGYSGIGRSIHCSFVNCSAVECGGAIYCGEDNEPGSFHDFNFTNCSAKNGGAIYSQKLIFIYTASFDSCSASDKGSVIYISNPGELVLPDNIEYTPIVADEKAPIYNEGTISGVVITTLDGVNMEANYGDAVNLTANVTANGLPVAGGIVTLKVNGVEMNATSDVNGLYSTSTPYTADFVGVKPVTATYLNGGSQTVNAYNLTVLVPNDSFTQLAKDVANSGNELVLNHSYHYYPECDSAYKNGVNVTKSIIIDGNSFALNGSNLARIFNIRASDVTLKNIELINGNPTGHGGAILWRGRNGAANNCTFVNFSATDGGAIYLNQTTNCNIISCNFINTTAYGSGSAIDCHDINKCYIKDCNFTNTSGGAVYLATWSNDCYIVNCTFNNTHDFFDGGAISCTGDNNYILDCKFINTSAGTYGGAISVVSNKCAIMGCTFINTSANYDGGAISLDGYSVISGSVRDCSFVNCNSRNGGAIYVGDAFGSVSGCNFSDCNASKNGSAIYISSSGSLNITNSTGTPIDNRAPIYNNGTILSNVVITTLNGTNKNATYGDRVTLIANVTTSDILVAGGKITFTVNNTNKNATSDIYGLYSTNYSVDFVGSEPVTATYLNATGNQTVNAYNITSTPVVLDINVSDVAGVYSDNITGSINTTQNGNITFTINGTNFTGSVTDGSFVIANVTGLNARNYIDIPVSFVSDDGYYIGNTIINFTINRKMINITATVDNITYGDNFSGCVNADVPGWIDVHPGEGPISYKFNTTGTFTTEWDEECILSPDTYTALITFISNDWNYQGEANVTYTISKATPTVNITVEDITYGDVEVVNITVVGLDGKAIPSGNVTISVNGTEYANVTLNDGVCTYNITGLNAGAYNITARYNGDINYTSIENSTRLTVIPKSIDMSAIIYNGTYGDNTISGVVNASMNGTVYIQIVTARLVYCMCDVNESGEFSVPVHLVAGDYPNNYVTFLSADGNYIGESHVIFNIAKADPQVTVDIGSEKSFDIKFGDTVVSIVTVPDDATGIVYFSLDNETWIPVTIKEGKDSVEFDIPDLDAGNYILFVKYSGDNNYNPVYSENPFSVNQLKTTVTVDPVKGKAGQKVKITVRVTDENGNPVEEGTVIIGFNGKEYKANVVNGIATIEVTLPNKAGTYSATAYYEGFNYNSSYTTFTVEVSDIPGPNPDPNPIKGNMENTGNPILVLLIALCAIGLESFRRKF